MIRRHLPPHMRDQLPFLETGLSEASQKNSQTERLRAAGKYPETLALVKERLKNGEAAITSR